MENPSSLEQNLNVLGKLMLDLNYTKDQVAIRGKWDMVAWLKKVRDRELQVDEIMEEFNEKTEEFSPNDLDAKDDLNGKLTESLTAVNVLIEEGNAGLESIADHLSSPENYQLKLFSSNELEKFTNFGKKLGVGGYSIVYQGEFEGEQVAVKVLKKNKMVHETFLAERTTMSRFSHTNLVKLHGFCFDDKLKALVYECMEKGSFDKILYENPYSVEWSQLYGIALDIARGLAYLHHDCGEQVIHHDIKAANVLIGRNLCPKITDFGVSNLMKSDATHIINTRTRGTDCYSAPEVYQPFSPISCKCDVYSFGIMMFEILGRRCSIPIKGQIWFPEEVSKMWNEDPKSVMERCKIKEEDRKKAKLVLLVAMWCAQYTPTIRPSMRDVVEVLEEEMSVKTPPYPFHHHNPLGHLMLSSLQGTLEIHPEVPVDEKSLAISYPNPVVVPDVFISGEKENKEELEVFPGKELKRYSPLDLQVFTSSFKDKLGSDGFGAVYKGSFPDGVQVAIQVFAHLDVIGEELFMNEVRSMSTLNHKNILRSYGYCLEEEMIAVIYEYMPFGSLDRILLEKHLDIEWGRLYKIVIEIAKGLSHMVEGHHEIIHFDVKPSNILLDENLSPKITGFGLAKSMASGVSHLTWTRTRGTPSYIAPEMWMPSSRITSKVDVYSFGIMLFEVLGRRNNTQPGQPWFPKKVWEKFESGEIEELIEDCGIEGKSREDAKILSMIALWCIQFIPDERPSMRKVVNMLEKELPVKPIPNPFILEGKYEYKEESDYDDEEEKEKEGESESESLLQLYEEKCPPGGENSVIIYTTTIEKMKKSFNESNDVCTILQSHQIKIIERDVWDYEDELKTFVKGIVAPVMFVKGRLIGTAAEVKRLETEGKLKLLLYGVPTEDSEAKKSTEQMLGLFEAICPPGGENSVIIYTTTIEGMKRPFQESNDVRAILQSHEIKMIERDVWGDDVDYEDELNDVLGKIQIPVLFVKGRFIGAADEVKRLETEGTLKVLLYGMGF